MNLLRLRKSMGITQREAADRLNCSILTYGRCEREEREPSIEMLIKMSDMFNVTVDYIIGKTNTLERNHLTEYEQRLIAASRSCDERARQDALMLMEANRK